ncbi:acetyl-CoA carboxylase biotin carboxylase subunit [Oscillospiraceae bacterium OttesenSCG-928-F05]|nr:acetyl-CoA carboxylase biotin carboxylase subunit [Oscillospiraceae bacterium OttesenSCG-928-F05]
MGCFKKILIANRGEIAVRIIRACRDMGIISVAVYSEADRDALHTQIADEAVCIGPAASGESYLNMDRVLSAALASHAEAIHPGFGFLSENADFAERCAKYGITFIGPKPETIRKLGNKAEARRTMQKAGVPIIPGSDGPVETLEDAHAVAEAIGYPLMVKASAGGGGRGIRLVETASGLQDAWNAAKAEAGAAFGDSAVYMERFIKNPRHIEFQIMADTFGGTVHLFERDCSIQRRHQKLLEESPSPFLSEPLRKAMGAAAVKAAKSAGYIGAGTVEFLVDVDGSFYFCEMNTRIQVEHPVTEWVTGTDLVALQIHVAAGEALPFKQKDLSQDGHAIECRINAEDPEANFAPRPGTIRALHLPGGIGVRVDSAVYQGYRVPPYYDSMVAKLIVHAPTRPEAIARMKRALVEFIFDGLVTNSDFQLALLNNADFAKGNYTVSFLDTHDIIDEMRRMME